MFPKEREIGRSSGMSQCKEDSENLSFFKILQGEDLSSESMRAFPYDFIRNLPQKDFSCNMVIRTQWGISWEVGVSMNPRFHYMEKHGWNQFVNDNALGDNELVTFTHTGLMCFSVNIYDENGKELVTPRTMASLSGIKKEEGESSNKDVKMDEETGGESTGGVKLKVRSMKFEGGETSKKKKIKSKNVEGTVSEFNITIRNSYLRVLPFPKHFLENHIPTKSKVVTIHHSSGNGSWEVLWLVNGTHAYFSKGWLKLAREHPLLIGDVCTFKLINPTEFHLVVSRTSLHD